MQYMNLISGTPPVDGCVDLGVQAHSPVKAEGYLPLCNDFLSKYIAVLSMEEDVDITALYEVKAMISTALAQNRISISMADSLLQSTYRLPRWLLSRAITYGEDYSLLLSELFTLVYSAEIEQASVWQSLAKRIDSPSSDLYPEERQMLTLLIEQHSIEIENAVHAYQGRAARVKCNRERKDYVSYKSLLREVLDVKAAKKRCTDVDEFLGYRILTAVDEGILTPTQAKELTDYL